MAVLSVPYHLDERLEGFTVGVPVDHEVAVDLPAGGPWARMAALYEQVAAVVSGQTEPPLVLSGDCTTSLGVLAGLQRAGHEVGIVWFDAHADFHTEASTTSGYLGGMPLALAAGVGTPTLPDALGLRPVPASQVVLVDARDTDPGEITLLADSEVTVTRLQDLEAALPAGPLYLHVDVDVCDPGEVPDLRYPAPGGPTAAEVLAAVRRVTATGRVVATGVAATWHHQDPPDPAHQRLARSLARVIAG